jgi:hypothetical protein
MFKVGLYLDREERPDDSMSPNNRNPTAEPSAYQGQDCMKQGILRLVKQPTAENVKLHSSNIICDSIIFMLEL